MDRERLEGPGEAGGDDRRAARQGPGVDHGVSRFVPATISCLGGCRQDSGPRICGLKICGLKIGGLRICGLKIGGLTMTAREHCEFFLLRYVPDAVKDEFVNVGLVLLPGSGPAEVRFTHDWSRVRCL